MATRRTYHIVAAVLIVCVVGMAIVGGTLWKSCVDDRVSAACTAVDAAYIAVPMLLLLAWLTEVLRCYAFRE